MDIYKTVNIPHLYFTVKFMDLEYLRGVEIQGVAYTAMDEKDGATIFIQDIEKSIKNPVFFPILAHEIMHVIQILCDRTSMKVETEQEHTAYLMTYLLNELLGYEAFKK